MKNINETNLNSIYFFISTGEKPLIEYVTDSGLIVPSISTDLRNVLLASAESSGMGADRMTELMARAGSDLAIQTLGGSHRLNPNNTHQTPKVVVLCGPSRTGAIGLGIGRTLASHPIQTFVYIPSLPHFPPTFSQELSLYELTGQRWTSDTTDLPKDADIVISALEDHEMFLQVTFF